MIKSILYSAFVVLLGSSSAFAEVISVPCVNGGGSGGWMLGGNLPKEYFPVVILGINQWVPRSVEAHPFYDPKATWNKYGTCAIAPSRQ